MAAEDDEMKPPQIAVQVLGGDAAEASRDVLDLAVAAGGRLDVCGPVHRGKCGLRTYRIWPTLVAVWMCAAPCTRSPLRLSSTKVSSASTTPASRSDDCRTAAAAVRTAALLADPQLDCRRRARPEHFLNADVRTG